MNNKDNYEKAINQIHASEELKEKAFENAKFARKNKYSTFKILSSCAAVIILFFVGINYMGNIQNNDSNLNDIAKNNEENKKYIIANAELPRFESMEQLKEVLKDKESSIFREEGLYFDGVASKSLNAANSEKSEKESISQEEISDLVATTEDFSRTNTQVENVDEADIVKTDGKYIYYVSNGVLFIVKSDDLEITSTIQIQNNDERFSISEIFLKDNKVILLGNGYILEKAKIENNEKDDVEINNVSVKTMQTARAIVYDIEDKFKPQKIREVDLEGYYMDSRMVGNNLYLISRKYAYFYKDMEDYTILPAYKDSVNKSSNETVKRINYYDIAYFQGSEDTSFMIVGGFNINENDEIYTETFFGAGDTVYANEKNLYLTQQNWDNSSVKTTIYKFALEDARVRLIVKGEVNGRLNNQFSMDEYDGNLRVATTSYIEENPSETKELNDGTVIKSLPQRTTTNNLYVLDDKLEVIGKIENLAEEEKIYSVRFIGKIGYIVTFKEVDPLFVIDLSEPENPRVKGELKIPGYSSYLHPYDENHIIGIGYNTKDNGYGGITNSTMKMSMFDVSDLENPQEIFSVDIGNDYASSEIIYNHKALFYKKTENLIGFPINYRENNYRDSKNGFIIFKIDLENNKFEKYGEILNEMDYRNDIRRVIYIKDILYTLGYDNIISYDLNTFEKIKEIELKIDEYINNYNLLMVD